MTERTIFIAALQIDDAAKRQAYLDEACAASSALRQRVDVLLRVLHNANGFLEPPVLAGNAGKEKLGLMALFDNALDIASPAERDAYFGAACAGTPELRKQVDALLAAYEKNDSSLEPPAPGEVSTLDTPILEGPGTVIGLYKLQEQIGHGGFGVVFMAEQKEPIRRKVALKVVKPGMDTKEVIARFEAERQALALMDHPNIAKALDAGQTTSGRPYFVMELVKGIPITKFCDESQLTLKQRLELFVHVCKAVQHAHQKGIIHRDIKPTNVLVTMQDGVPLVKVIDFGIAKALGQQLTDKSFFTGFAQMIGTPLYMSPEQAALSNVDVDTRSDIYSLGVLLYELLTGTTPVDKKRLHQAAYDEIRRIIREEEAPKPSTRVSSLGQEGSIVSAQRKSDSKRLSRLFRGELDWIVMKALDKDRNRRFETANGFAEDIQRYLADEPVLAGAPSMTYRLHKYVRRHRVGLVIAVVITSALLVALTTVAGSIGWVIGERSAREAEITRRVRDAMALARGLVADNKPTQARERLDVARGLIARDREALPALAAELDGLVENLDRFAKFLKFIDQAREAETTYLGYSPKRGTLLIKALGCYEVLEREDWIAPLAQSALAKQQVKQVSRTVYEELLWLANHALSWWHDPRSSEGPGYFGVVELEPEATAAFVRARSESAARGALAYLKVAEKAQAPTHWFYQLRADCHHTLGHEEEAGKDHELARQIPPTMVIDYFFEAQAAFQKANLAEAAKALEAGLRLEPTHLGSLLLLGSCQMAQGQREPDKVEAAISTYSGVIAKQPTNVRAWFERGLANKMLGRSEAAAKDFAKAKELRPDYERTWIVQGDAYSELRQWDRAISEYTKAIEYTSSRLGLAERARAYINLAQWDWAIAEYSEALDRGDRRALNALAVIYGRQGHLEMAITACSKLIDQNPKRNGWALEIRGELYGKIGQWDKALADYSEAVKLDGDRKFKRASTWNNWGLAYLKLGKPDQALADFSKAIELDKQIALIWSSEGYYGDQSLGLFDKAQAEFARANKIKPDDAHYLNALAWLLVAHADPKVRDPRRALELAEKAVKREPKDGNYWNTLGAAHYRAGNWQAALQALDKSIEVKTWYDPRGSGYQWLFLAMAHWQLGHRDEARNAYDRGVIWMKGLPNNAGLNWPPAKGPDTDELRRFRAEAANLLGIQE